MCVDAFVPKTPFLNEKIYRYGDKCSHMYFIVSGTATYWHYSAAAQAVRVVKIPGDGETSSPFTRSISVHQGQWLCEASVWLQWLHRGDLSSTNSVSLLVLCTESFAAVAAQHPALWMALSSHARRFVESFDSVVRIFATD